MNDSITLNANVFWKLFFLDFSLFFFLPTLCNSYFQFKMLGCLQVLCMQRVDIIRFEKCLFLCKIIKVALNPSV